MTAPVVGATITGVYEGEIVHARVLGFAQFHSETLLITDELRNGARLAYRMSREGVVWIRGHSLRGSSAVTGLLAAVAREGEKRVRVHAPSGAQERIEAGEAVDLSLAARVA